MNDSITTAHTNRFMGFPLEARSVEDGSLAVNVQNKRDARKRPFVNSYLLGVIPGEGATRLLCSRVPIARRFCA